MPVHDYVLVFPRAAKLLSPGDLVTKSGRAAVAV
jgi:hypothetical protein